MSRPLPPFPWKSSFVDRTDPAIDRLRELKRKYDPLGFFPSI